MSYDQHRFRISISKLDIRNQCLSRVLNAHAEAGRSISTIAAMLMIAGVKYLESQNIDPTMLVETDFEAELTTAIRQRPAAAGGQGPQNVKSARGRPKKEAAKRLGPDVVQPTQASPQAHLPAPHVQAEAPGSTTDPVQPNEDRNLRRADPVALSDRPRRAIAGILND